MTDRALIDWRADLPVNPEADIYPLIKDADPEAFLNAGALGMSAISPFGAPLSTHFTIVCSSCSESDGSSRISLMPTVGSRFHGGISRFDTRFLIERAHGRASS